MKRSEYFIHYNIGKHQKFTGTLEEAKLAALQVMPYSKSTVYIFNSDCDDRQVVTRSAYIPAIPTEQEFFFESLLVVNGGFYDKWTE